MGVIPFQDWVLVGRDLYISAIRLLEKKKNQYV